jgi:hypothetical protein
MSSHNIYSEEDIVCKASLNMTGVVSIVVFFCSAGLVWAYRNVRKVTSINLSNDMEIDLDEQDSVSYDNVTPSQRKLLL